MSEYQVRRKPRFILRSIEAVKEKLNLRELSICAAEAQYLTTKERVLSLGESINRELNRFYKENNIRYDNDRLINNMARVLSLKEALSEEHHDILGKLVSKKLSPKEVDFINKLKLSSKDNVDYLDSLPARDVECLLEKMVMITREAHDLLSKVEKEIITENAAKSLNVMGYEVAIKEKGKSSFVRGFKKDLSIVAKITDYGELHVDMAGFEGESCKIEMDKLTNELEKHGITFMETERNYHGKRGGGVLVQEIKSEIDFDYNPLKKFSINSSKKQVPRLALLKRMNQKMRIF